MSGKYFGKAKILISKSLLVYYDQNLSFFILKEGLIFLFCFVGLEFELLIKCFFEKLFISKNKHSNILTSCGIFILLFITSLDKVRIQATGDVV